MQRAAIEMHSVGKRFRLGGSASSLMRAAGRRLIRMTDHNKPPDRDPEFWALQDVELQVQRGDSVGVIGPNGAGKSTVLKLLAGILKPDQGTVLVRGRLAALIEVGAGFHGDLTGRENIFLNGVILGMSRREIRRKFEDIVGFAGLERFLDTPVKRYSSGMYARLGFSIAAHVEPEILLVDEVLSVGDAMFRVRCDERMRQLVAAGTTLVFVTHNMEQMQATCKRGVVLQCGRVSFAGPAPAAVQHYMATMSQVHTARPSDILFATGSMQNNIAIRAVQVFQNGTDATMSLEPSEPFQVCVALETAQPKRLAIELNLRAAGGENLLSLNSARSGSPFTVASGASHVRLIVRPIPLAAGRYYWNVRVWDADSSETLIDTPFSFPMLVATDAITTGRLAVEHRWELVRADHDMRPPIETPADRPTLPIGAEVPR